jgi:hypothetical protein
MFQTSSTRIFTAPMKEKIKIFHLRGGMDYKNLGPLHRAGMR